MRDSDENPLALNWREYDALMRFIDFLTDEPDAATARQPPKS
jgi:hypothetical protein